MQCNVMYVYVCNVCICVYKKNVTTNYYYDCYCYYAYKIYRHFRVMTITSPAKCVAKGEPSDWEDDVGGEFSVELVVSGND